MANYYVGEASYKTVRIDEHEYQVPEAVYRHLEKLDDTLDKERAQHEKEVAKLQKVATKDFDMVSERIITNLNHGLEPIHSKYRMQEYEMGTRCLVYDINTYSKTDSFGEPILTFRKEVKRRIMAALLGETATGKEFK